MVKLPPQDIEAEKSVLGALMINPQAIVKVCDVLSPEDFYKPEHQEIYSVIVDLFSKNEPIDILSVSSELKRRKKIRQIGGVSYLTDLVEGVASASHITHYAKIVREKRNLRDLLGVAAEITEKAFEQKEAKYLLDEIEQKIFKISQHSLVKERIPWETELKMAFERIEKLQQKKEGLRGIPTGFKKLDNYLSGLQKSNLIILGARPSLGKTAFVLDIARHVTTEQHIPVAFFSLEMSKDEIIDRLISAESSVDLWKLRTGRVDDSLEFEMIQSALDRLSKTPIFIEDYPSPTVLQIRSISRRLQLEKGLGLIIIDYVQLITPSGNFDNPVHQFTEISHGLKTLARQLEVPVLAVSQLTRAVDQRETGIPRLSDLRETGSWEQDADVVMFLYRQKEQLEDLGDSNLMKIRIAKHRNGPLGVIELNFDPQKVTFREIDETL